MPEKAHAPHLVLNADDYAMTEGVSRGIERLVEAGRLSSTSAIVTSRHWQAHARRIAPFRDRAAIGLHLNLTLGSPLGSMPDLARDGAFPKVDEVARRAMQGRLDTEEIAREAVRQIDCFAEHSGALPDFIDGHQHVHAFPGVRDALLAAAGLRFAHRSLLVRDPALSLRQIAALGSGAPKAAAIGWLSRGFGAQVRRLGFVTNDAFAGVSDFAPEAVEADFARVRAVSGRLVIAMCHPGHVDEELGRLDPLTVRRQRELDVLMDADPFAGSIWRPARAPQGAIDWAREFSLPGARA